MNSDGDDPKGSGFPIRISADQSSFAAPHGFSQRTTSFIASRCQGIHQTPLRRLIVPTSNGQRPNDRTSRPSPPTPSLGNRTFRQHCITQSARPNDPDDPTHTPFGASLGPGLARSHALHHVQQPRATITRSIAPRPSPQSRPRPANRRRRGNLPLSRSSRHPNAGTRTQPRQVSQRQMSRGMVGQGRLELPTSRLSSARSNQLSYWPAP